MSSSHRVAVQEVVPDISRYEASIASLRRENGYLASSLADAENRVGSLAGSVSSFRGDVTACRRDNQLLGNSLRETQGTVRALSEEQQTLQENHERIEDDLVQANHHIDQLRQSHSALQSEVTQVQYEQQRQNKHLAGIDTQIRDLGEGQNKLRQELKAQREEIAREIQCLREYDQFLTTQVTQCQSSIRELAEVTGQLEEQQNRTKQMLQEVAHHSQQVREELLGFEKIVEERHEAAEQKLRKEKLEAKEAQKVATENFELIDRSKAVRFGCATDCDAIAGVIRQADGFLRADNLQAALAAYCQASSESVKLRKQVQESEEKQTQREGRIRHHIEAVRRVVENWRDDAYIKSYRQKELENLKRCAQELDDCFQDLTSKFQGRDLTEGTVRLEMKGEEYGSQSKKVAEEFPELIRKVKQRKRFIDAIRQAVADSFALAGRSVTHDSKPVLADPKDRNSPLRFAVGSEHRKIIAEIDLDGNCHFWYEGYPERTHVKDIDEFEQVLRKGRKLTYRATSPRTFKDQGKPPYEPPPSDIPDYVPRKKMKEPPQHMKTSPTIVTVDEWNPPKDNVIEGEEQGK